MATVLTYGTFDLFHYGHLELLQRAHDLGGASPKLIVGISTDEFNLAKGKQSVFSFEKRRRHVMSLRFVDQVIAENNWEQKIQDVIDNKVDLFLMGDDWAGKFDFLKEHCEVLYLPRTEIISTTLLKKAIGK